MKITLHDEIPVSWNAFYAGRHWRVRGQEASRVHMLVRSELDPETPPFGSPVNITVTYYRPRKRTTRHDGLPVPMDSCNVPSKLYIDGLVPFVIVDDSYRYVAAVTGRVIEDETGPRVEIEVTAA